MYKFLKKGFILRNLLSTLVTLSQFHFQFQSLTCLLIISTFNQPNRMVHLVCPFLLQALSLAMVHFYYPLSIVLVPPGVPCVCCSVCLHQGGGKPVHIKMTLFGLYLIRYQPHLSIFESFWFHEESKIWNRACGLKRIADPKSSSNDPVFNLLLHHRSKWFRKE
jgi:hypothetical protein